MIRIFVVALICDGNRSVLLVKRLDMSARIGTSIVLAITLLGCSYQKQPASSPGAPGAATSVTATAQHNNSGWYLMQPPVYQGKLDTGAMPADWQTLEFYQSSAPCDAARAQGLLAYASYDTAADPSAQLGQRLASFTLCVAADDPSINWFQFSVDDQLRRHWRLLQ